MIEYTSNEDQLIAELKEYVDSTYGEHYQGNHALEAWRRKGILLEAAESNLWKYLERFGRKEGHNEKDLWKMIHYLLFMIDELRVRKANGEVD